MAKRKKAIHNSPFTIALITCPYFSICEILTPESRIPNPVFSTTPPTILAYPPSFVKRHGVRFRQPFRQDVGCQGGGLSGNNF